jgi:hypothetical protein
MAVYTVQTAKSATLVASTVDTVLVQSFGHVIEVCNRSATAGDFISITVGNTVADTPSPTVLGDNCFVVGPNQKVQIPWPVASAGQQAAVELISSTTPPYTVQVFATRNG